MIMKGKFSPGLTSIELRQSIMDQLREGRSRLVTQVPWAELNKLSNARINQPLSPEMFRRRQGEAQAAPVTAAQPEATGNIFGDININTAPAAPTQVAVPAPAAPVMPPSQAPANAVPPMALLGSDPVTQARNAEILQRIQSQ